MTQLSMCDDYEACFDLGSIWLYGFLIVEQKQTELDFSFGNENVVTSCHQWSPLSAFLVTGHTNATLSCISDKTFADLVLLKCNDMYKKTQLTELFKRL